MKSIISTIILTVASLTAASATEKYKLEDFAIQLEQVTSSPSHVWVSSGYTTVNPDYPTVTGVNDLFSPPFAVRGFNMRVDLRAGDQTIPDAGSYGKGDVGMLYSGGVWYPHKIVRRGTYHHLKAGKLISLGITTELIPLMGRSGFMEKIIISNRADTSVEIELAPLVTPGNPDVVPLDKWEFSPPQSTAPQAGPMTDGVWSNGVVKMGLYIENKNRTLAPGETMVAVVTVIADHASAPLPEKIYTRELEAVAVDTWEKRLATHTADIPVLSSNIEGLDDYYKRSLVSALVCIWENPEFALNPFFATSGIDGGGLCTYLWDNAGYTPNTSSMMFGPRMVEIARKMASIDLEKYYAFSLAGNGIGVKYSFSPWAFTTLVSSLFKFTGPDRELYEYNKKIITNDEKRKGANGLIDYGLQHNLLEMRGTGWEHQVVSPNAERNWSLRQLALMGEMVGEDAALTAEWNSQADDIVASVRRELWDGDKQWFASLYPGGYRDYVHSIQVYDALWAGACTPEMEKVLVGELREGGYLGSHGVSSISKADSVHFEVVDTDWSGGGAYTGDSPQVAQIMYDRGHPEVAWDIMKRLFWMGRSFIYYPQEHFIDRPMSPVGKRANNAAGLCGVETILFGLFGMQPTYSGELYINPQLSEGSIDLRDFVYRGNHFDVEAQTTNLKVTRNGEVVYNGVPRRVKIL